MEQIITEGHLTKKLKYTARYFWYGMQPFIDLL